jgi:hypothetical protein
VKRIIISEEAFQTCVVKLLIKLHLHLHVTTLSVKKKVKQSRYTPWRRLGGEEV